MLPRKLTNFFEAFGLASYFGFGLLEMVLYTCMAPRFWWLRRRGRAAEADAIAHKITQAWAARILHRFGCVVEARGQEHIPAEGPFMVMCNHQSLFDIPVIMTSTGRMVGFVAKRELFRLPGFGFWMRQIHSVSLDRANAAAAARLYREVSGWLKRSNAGLVMFPEGTRTRDPDARIGPFREGSIRLATLEDIPILPVSTDGSRFLGKCREPSHARRGKKLVRIKFAPLVRHSVRSTRERRELLESIRATIVANFEILRSGRPAEEKSPRLAPQPGEMKS